MNFGRILLFAFLLYYSTIVLTVSSAVVSADSNFIIQTKPNQELYLRQHQLKTEYQQSLKTLLENYSHEEGKQQSMQKFEDDLLVLMVPVEFRNLHFQLVGAINKFKEGDLASLDETSLILEKIVKKYSWLSSELSLFIINNFY
ncbi:hypothetical protein KKF32_01480 [Patescibacteria group bacterium]|nr:hypothetical protein [Patescibacteria group bacterium]